MSTLYTIGFTRKTAEQFFGLIRQAGVQRVFDTRLNNLSQLAGFSKKDDLRFFLSQIGGVEYEHCLALAPESGMLERYRRKETSWAAYEMDYLDLLQRRHVEKTLDRSAFSNGCLLCSEPTAHFCHRRLAAEYLSRRWDDVDVMHL